jgi:DNA repair photolyase
MNRQIKKRRDGRVFGRGIQWTDFTWNPIGGCNHACRWKMPDGTIAECYAETTAKKFKRHYPHGFEHHYWRPEKLHDPIKLNKPARIFVDSMSDLMGAWVPEEQVRQVLDICGTASWHQFQLLTKNPGRLSKFEFPDNVWVGASSPPGAEKVSGTVFLKCNSAAPETVPSIYGVRVFGRYLHCGMKSGCLMHRAASSGLQIVTSMVLEICPCGKRAVC